MINIINKEDCCGCTACASVCPSNAITMIPDSLGFKYPIVDKDICINCGLCNKICDFNKSEKLLSINPVEIKAFGGRHRDIKELESSQSGAAFIALAEAFIKNYKGIVYGVKLGEDFVVRHSCATKRSEIDSFKGSKYVQSELDGIFCLIKKDLLRGHNVLFVGTPCQVAGLKNFLPKRLHNLIFFVDIICHGVSGPKFFEDYLMWARNRYGYNFQKFNFRDKRYGWHSCNETFYYDNKETCIVSEFKIYRELYIRKSCYVCKYSTIDRVSDITIGDYWGLEEKTRQFADNKGCSLVLCNTLRGKTLFDLSEPYFDSFETKLEDCLQPNLKEPTPRQKLRDKFEYDYQRHGFNYITKKYGGITYTYEIKRIIKRLFF